MVVGCKGERLEGKCCVLSCMLRSCVRFCRRVNTKQGQIQKKTKTINFTKPTHDERQRDDGERGVGEKVQCGNECPSRPAGDPANNSFMIIIVPIATALICDTIVTGHRGAASPLGQGHHQKGVERIKGE